MQAEEMMEGNGEAERVWAGALEALRLRMARETFQRWLLGSRVVESGEGRLTIGIEAAYGAEWLEGRLRGVIEQVVRQAAGRPVAVSFRAIGPGREEEQGKDGSEEVAVEEAATRGRGDEAVEPSYSAASVPDPKGSGARAAGERSESRTSPQGDRTGREGPGQTGREGGGGKLSPLDYYIRIKTAFRLRALGELSGTEVKVFLCIALHLDGDGTAKPGIETIMKETRLSKSAVCSAIARLVCLGLVSKELRYHQKTRYTVNGYAWFGPRPAPALWEEY